MGDAEFGTKGSKEGFISRPWETCVCKKPLPILCACAQSFKWAYFKLIKRHYLSNLICITEIPSSNQNSLALSVNLWQLQTYLCSCFSEHVKNA